MDFDAVVVGGGISGLVAARRLQSAGARVALVEASDRLGGKVVTERWDGFTVEGGPDSFVVAKRSVMELAEELGIGDRVVSSRTENRGSFVLWQGRLHPLPEGLLLMAPTRLRPLFGSSLLSWRGKLRVLADLVLPKAEHGADESLESFVTRRLGREVLERIAEPLIAGIHAAEPATMSLRASFPRFLEMEDRHRSLILAARAAASAAPGGDGISYFASFRDGMGELTDALIGGLSRVDIMTGVSVVRFVAGTRGTFSVTLSNGTELSSSGVVLAVPASASARLLAESVPEAASAVAGINQVSTAIVTVAYQSEDLPPLMGSGFVVPSVERRRIMGVSYSSRKWEGRVPGPEVTLLRAFVGGAHGRRLAAGDARVLEDVVREELEEILGITAPPLFARCHSWVDGLHQYTLGHIERVAQAEDALSGMPGLAVAGAGFHGIGLNECITSGDDAARRVLSSLGDVAPASRRDREPANGN